MTCPICARREPADGLTIDAVCLARIDDDLARIVELVAQASDWLHPRQGTSGVRSVPGSRPPLSVEALDAAVGNDVLPVLEEFERMTREHFGLGPYGIASAARGASVKGCCDFLRAWLFRIAETADYPVEVLADEVKTLRWGGELPAGHFSGLEVLDPDHDRPDGIRVQCLGDHPDADGRTCGNRLTIEPGMLSQDVTCRRCGNVTTAGHMIYTALSDPAVTVWAYPDVIEATLGVKASTLRQWVHRGHVTKRGGRYDAGAVYRRRNTPVTEVAGS
jgi:hypothetical protein